MFSRMLENKSELNNLMFGFILENSVNVKNKNNIWKKKSKNLSKIDINSKI